MGWNSPILPRRYCEDCGLEIHPLDKADRCDLCAEKHQMRRADPGEVELAKKWSDEIERAVAESVGTGGRSIPGR